VLPFKKTVIYDLIATKEEFRLVKEGGSFRWTITAKIKKDDNLVLDFQDSSIELPRVGKFIISVIYKGWDNKQFGLKNVFIGILKSNDITIEILE